ncbi:MAG: rhomboid family intramembrane serine protease [Bacteroidia bacterium]
MSYQEFRTSRFQLLPPVIKNLIIINAILFFASIVLKSSFGIDLTDILGLHYYESNAFRPYQFVTYMFMHGGIGHIFFNMLALWMFGNALENVWGTKRFLIFYFVTGIGAALVYMAYQWFSFNEVNAAVSVYVSSPSVIAFGDLIHKQFPMVANSNEITNFISEWSNQSGSENYFVEQSYSYIRQLMEMAKDNVTVGASGSVYGVLLGFGMLFPNTIIYMIFPFPFPIKAKYLVLIYGGLEVYLTLANNPEDNIAHLAHLGGMLFGFILIKLWNKRNREFFY